MLHPLWEISVSSTRFCNSHHLETLKMGIMIQTAVSKMQVWAWQCVYWKKALNNKTLVKVVVFHHQTSQKEETCLTWYRSVFTLSVIIRSDFGMRNKCFVTTIGIWFLFFSQKCCFWWKMCHSDQARMGEGTVVTLLLQTGTATHVIWWS